MPSIQAALAHLEVEAVVMVETLPLLSDSTWLFSEFSETALEGGVRDLVELPGVIVTRDLVTTVFVTGSGESVLILMDWWADETVDFGELRWFRSGGAEGSELVLGIRFTGAEGSELVLGIRFTAAEGSELVLGIRFTGAERWAVVVLSELVLELNKQDSTDVETVEFFRRILLTG